MVIFPVSGGVHGIDIVGKWQSPPHVLSDPWVTAARVGRAMWKPLGFPFIPRKEVRSNTAPRG